MVAKTVLLASTDGCTAILNYDDVSLLASSVVVACTGTIPVTFYINAGTLLSVTAQPGTTHFLNFLSAIPVTLGSPKPSSINLSGLINFGIGTGAGIGT